MQYTPGLGFCALLTMTCQNISEKELGINTYALLSFIREVFVLFNNYQQLPSRAHMPVWRAGGPGHRPYARGRCLPSGEHHLTSEVLSKRVHCSDSFLSFPFADVREGCAGLARPPNGSSSLSAVWGLPRESSPGPLFVGVVLPSGLACFSGASS